MPADFTGLFDGFFKIDKVFGFKNDSFSRVVNISTKTSDGVKVKSSSTFGSSTVQNKASVSYSHKESGVDLKKFELDDGKSSAKFEVGYSKIANVAPSVSVTYGKKNEMSAEVKYTRDNLEVTAGADLMAFANSQPNVKVSSSINIPDSAFTVNCGFKHKIDDKDKDPALHGNVCYAGSSTLFTVGTSAASLGVPDSLVVKGLFTRGASQLAFCGSHSFAQAEGKSPAFTPDLQLGVAHKLSSESTVRALLTNDHNVFLKYSQRVSPLVSADIYTEVLKTKGQNMGFALSFNA